MDIMANLFNICDPLKPPPEGTYVDCSSAQGGTAVVSILARRIRRAIGHTHLLFSGHTGGGKSTELLRLCEQLRNPSGNSDVRFFPVYMDAEDYVSFYDVEVTEILLAIVGSVAESLRESEDIHLESSYLKSRWEEFRDVALTPVEMEKAEFSLSKFAKFTTSLKKADIDSRRKVRERLTPQLPSLLDEINLVFEKARIELKERGYQDLVLVVDNLEKITDVDDSATGRGAYYRVFVVGGEQLSSIAAHTVLTVPLPLIHSPRRTQLVQTFGEEPFVLPMVKIEEENGEPYEEGLELMREVLRRRFKIEGVGETDVFDPDNIFTHLCRMSGGHVRNLLIYFRSASDYVDLLPFTEESVRRGIRQHINAYSRSIPGEHWKLLARLHLDTDKYIPNDDEHQSMLGDLSILEYLNGEELWYAVNPVVRELEKFKRAVEAIKKGGGTHS